VQPVGETNGVRMDVGLTRPPVAQALAEIDRRQQFDKEADSLVVSWVNHSNGDVVHQFPNEQQLRIRAYWREQDRQAKMDRQAKSDDIVA